MPSESWYAYDSVHWAVFKAERPADAALAFAREFYSPRAAPFRVDVVVRHESTGRRSFVGVLVEPDAPVLAAETDVDPRPHDADLVHADADFGGALCHDERATRVTSEPASVRCEACKKSPDYTFWRDLRGIEQPTRLTSN